MKYCAQCKLDLPDTSKFCRSCGGNLSEAETVIETGSRCKKCRAEVQMNWKTCSRCGYPIHSAAPTVKISPALICSGCGMMVGKGMKFCIGCGAAIAPAENTQIEMPVSEGNARAGLAPTIIEKLVIPPEPALPQPDVACRKCGVMVRTGLKFCEKCGAPVAVQSTIIQPDNNRKILFMTSGAALALILLIVGWYLWGVSVTVISNQPGVQVFIDDTMAASSGDGSQRITISHVLRGEHTLRVKRDGFEDAVSTLKLGLGDFSKTVEVNLTPYLYSLMIKSVPTACKVLIDGKEAGATDSNGELTLKNVARGSHTLTIQRAGYQDWAQNVSLTSSQTIKAELTFSIGGSWQGSYAVSQSTPSGFTLSITQTGATFTGRADQRDNNNTESNASLEGSINGRQIKYVKRYGNGGTADYTGTVDASGSRVSGTWVSGSASGTWVMAKVEKADSGWIAPIYSKIDSFNANVSELKFYETGNGDTSQRRYSTRFAGSSTRYINYELDLKYAAPGRRIEFETRAIYYNADGTVLGERTRQARVDADWNESNHYDGWGSNTPGTWKTGFYRVDIFVAGKRIASKWFEVY